MAVVWGLAAAVAAGIARDPRIVLFVPFLFLPFFLRSSPSGRKSAALALTAALYFLYGCVTIAGERAAIRIVQSVAGPGRVLVVEGWVSGFPQVGFGKTTFELDARVAGGRRRLLVEANVFGVGYGDSVRVAGRLLAAHRTDGRSYRGETYLLSRGVSGVLRAGSGGVAALGGSGGSPITRHVLWPLRDRIRRETASHLGDRAGIALALLLGERGVVERGLRERVAELGISHLLALSGLHLGFIAAVLILLSRALRLRPLGVLGLGLALYVGVVGPVLSLYRAFLMASMLILARAVNRALGPITALANAFLLMLLVRPGALYSVGFQLSFLATLAVLAGLERFGPPAPKSRVARMWVWARVSVLISSGVQLFLAPVLLHYFGRLSIVAPLATLLFLPFVAAILAASALSVLVSVVWPAAGVISYSALDRGLALFHWLLNSARNLAPDPLAIPVPDFAAYYSGLLILWIAGRRRWLKWAGACLFVGSILAALAGKN